MRSACASLWDIFKFDIDNYRLLIRPLRNHPLQNHKWSSGYDINLTLHQECTSRESDPGHKLGILG